MTAMVRLAASSVVELHRRHAARQIVVQVKQSGGALLVRRKMHDRLRILKKDVGVLLGMVEVEETEGQIALFVAHFVGQAVRGGQPQPAGILRQKNCHPRDEQGARQLLDDGVEQRLQIGFGAQAAAEFDQRPAVVVAMAVESAIDPALNAALERIEDGSRDQNGSDQAPLAHRLRHGVVNHDRNERDDAEVSADDKTRGQHVGHAALEDQVRVHQPVADDGPGEGERQKYQRKAGQIGEQLRRIQVQQIRNRVKERERQNREQRSARDPLQLLAQQRRGRRGCSCAGTAARPAT